MFEIYIQSVHYHIILLLSLFNISIYECINH